MILYSFIGSEDGKKVKKNLKKIALFSTSQDKKILSISEQCKEILINKGIEVLIDKNLSKLKDDKLSVSSQSKIKNESDLVIAIGGDGTMLSCSRVYGSKSIPVLGINLGNLGFLTDIDPSDLTADLLNILDGNFVEDERFFIEAKLSNSNKTFLALNEVVIHSGAVAKLIEYEMYVNDSFVYRQKSDGLIVSSPTGSTAYSLSAGGPIIHPKVNSFLISPMFPLSLSSSPLMINADQKISISIINSGNNAELSLDSQNIVNLGKTNEVLLYKSKSLLTLMHPISHDFFESCRNKLGWSSAPKSN